MKTVHILFLVTILFSIIVWRRKTKTVIAIPIKYVTLETDSQSTKYLPIVSKDFLSEIEKNYAGKDDKAFLNAYMVISGKLCTEVYDKSRYWEKNMSHSEFLNKLTKEQRIFFTLLNFEGQVDNGGVYQFLFNQPELSLIALEAMTLTGMDTLAKDYKVVLIEMFGKFESISELKIKFQDNNRDWNSRWNAFTKGYNELPSAQVIESYFYNDVFKKSFHTIIMDYIRANQKNLFREEE